jgi:hypothetical protein
MLGKKLQEFRSCRIKNRNRASGPDFLRSRGVFGEGNRVSGIKFRKLRDLCVSVVNFPLRDLLFSFCEKLPTLRVGVPRADPPAIG